MPIAIPRATLERGWPRLSARGALAAAPASIPNTAVRIFPVIALDLEVYTSDCMLKVQMGGFGDASRGRLTVVARQEFETSRPGGVWFCSEYAQHQVV